MGEATSRKYFIRDTRQTVGNCALWCAKDSKGYTTQLDEAGEYDEAEALSTERGSDGVHRAIPCDVVRGAAVTHVRVERLKREVEAWKKGERPAPTVTGPASTMQTSKAALEQAASEAWAATLRLRALCEREGRVGWVSDLGGPARMIARVRDLVEQLNDERSQAPAQPGLDFAGRPPNPKRIESAPDFLKALGDAIEGGELPGVLGIDDNGLDARGAFLMTLLLNDDAETRIEITVMTLLGAEPQRGVTGPASTLQTRALADDCAAWAAENPSAGEVLMLLGRCSARLRMLVGEEASHGR